MNCNNSGDDFFSQPAVKVFAKQLQSCQWSEERKCWLLPLKSSVSKKEIVLPIHSVWLQGNVHAVINSNCLILKDMSGLVKVVFTDNVAGVDKVAGGGQWIEKGVYCSVVGEIDSSSASPKIKACKMTSLNSNTNLQLLWPWEVEDLTNILVDNWS